MTYEEYNEFCGSMKATHYVMQWGGSHVWKVGLPDKNKVFAIGGWADDYPGMTFKVSDIGYEILKDQPGCRPAPYLASRGMKWIQNYAEPGLSDEELKGYLIASYELAAKNLTKKAQRELGLLE